ncbi:hypothetical protein [Flexivirga oryzae]|uniref:Uncharacterized protein n=1 Tax=Flexivirga oryzae TaxID=1794944 RepID=A0A839MZ22_9MICO|nr:hypothetical protein [Flexivirga oryzae]MBB2890407.1 hypothetical protein [Flexivirga oryzae]
MSFTTDELRAAMQSYADDVALPDPAALVAGAEHKRAHSRRVRTAVVAGAAAVLMAVVTVVGIHGIGDEKALTPAQLNKKFHTHYAEYTHGLKLTDIVEVPIQKVADPNSAGRSSKAVEVTFPAVGSAVYIACDHTLVTGTLTAAQREAESAAMTQLRGSADAFATCDPMVESMLGAVKPGEGQKLWIATSGVPKRSQSPIAIYTQVDWESYPAKTHNLTAKPNALTAISPGEFDARFAGTGAVSASKRVRVPASVLRGAQLSVAPSSTGRFQVLVDGKAQRLDYTGEAAADSGGSWGWLPPGPEPEVRGTWYDYWPDSARSNLAAAPAMIAGPNPGASALITIRAVGATGPWQAMLTWQKK